MTIGPIASLAVALAASGAPLLGPIPPGPHAVTLRVLAEKDEARAERPLQIALWLPADDPEPEALSLTYQDYLDLLLSERGGDPPAADALEEARGSWRRFLEEHGVSGQTARAWLAAPMLARAGAPSAGGPFPLVIMAQGNGQSAVDQAVLAELVASHGYAVATCPSPMNLSGPMRDSSEIGPRAEEQAADLAFVLKRLGKEPGVDAARVALVGYSFGARGALLFAMQEPAVAALVSLDGGIGTALGREALEASTWFTASGLRAPVLHVYEELDDFMTPDPGLLRSVSGGGLELLPTRGMHHLHFTSLGFAAAAWPDVARATGAGPGLSESLAAIVDRVLATLARGLGVATTP